MLVTFGSGTSVTQLAPHGLIDEYQFVVDSIVIGKGRTLFEGMEKRIALKLLSSRSFANGNVVLTYAPAYAFRI